MVGCAAVSSSVSLDGVGMGVGGAPVMKSCAAACRAISRSGDAGGV